MDRWIALHNIADFEKRLAAERDPERRKLLEDLLRQERARCAPEARQIA